MHFPSRYLQPALLYITISLFIVTVEMRPGRVYQILQMLLFQDSVLSLTLYLLVFSIVAWSFQAALFNKSRAIGILTMGIWLPFLFISLLYRFISGYNYNYADAHTALNNTQFATSAFENYTLPVLLALFSAVLIGILVYIIRRRLPYLHRPLHALALVPSALISYWYISNTLGVIDDLPALYRVPLSTYIAHSHALPSTPRVAVLQKSQQAGVKHLFMLVDESITGSALAINGATANTTPFLNSVAGQFQNFGIASAYTNYSAGSNIALMSGLQAHELPDYEKQALKKPSIFQYAKQAGYETYFIDMQMGRGILQNYVTPYDLESIDHYIFVTEEQLERPYYERDHYIADMLLKMAKSDQKVFVYANKVGAHWPYARTYPADSAFFMPVLSERSMLKDREKSTNTYFNSIRWSVDEFWKKLYNDLTPQDSTFIVYTSDHGQDLSGDGISIVHARNQDIATVEADVPLWCLDKTGYTASFPIPAPNRQTHAQIFPTLLLLQGYDPSFIINRYGPTLYDSPPTKRSFLSGDIFGRGRSNVHDF
ncbi:sulfatase-like hydrolase/transferase [uncultured Pontibacter sp.]|uniref:sulfatase-like hydrolase/transferase n=1 Tax=uncultured Pontibacter sp. TaxID=453356 RepID=UPI00263926CD|nr:sulfatase-like hydrolase/transferase [uncultured Pontibacter sp.]